MTLRVAGNYITNLEFIPFYSGSGHLQIVRDQGGLLREVEVQSGNFLTLGDWAFPDFNQFHGGPTDYISSTDVVENADRYVAVNLNLQAGQEEKYVWELLEQFHDALSVAGKDLDYDDDQNSNSYINTALSVVGLDLAPLIPSLTTGDITGYPGDDNNVLQGAKVGGLLSGSDTPISIKLAGTDGNDIVVLGIGDDEVGIKKGNDTFDGGEGTDVASLSGHCYEYDIDRGEDGSVTIRHVSPSSGGVGDGIDTLVNVEELRFESGTKDNKDDDHVVDLTADELFGCTLITIPADLIEGSGSSILQTWSRSGDLDYSFDFFNDGEFLRPANATFVNGDGSWGAGQQTLDWGIVPIGRSVFGPDELVRVEYYLQDDSPYKQSVFFSVAGEDPSDNATVRYLSIGDAVDDRGGLTFGDPHLITFDNIGFDFQAAGEFVLTRATSGPAYEVQARFVAVSSAISVTEAVATTVDGTSISVEADGGEGTLQIGGVETGLADGDSISVGSGNITRTGNNIEIDHGNGDVTRVDVFNAFLNVTPQPSESRDPGSLEGLLGNANGTPIDDFRLSDGTVLTTPLPVETLYGDFASSWIVADADRLLPGDREAFDAPDRIVTIDSLPDTLRQAAEAAVDARGITNPLLREAAILDFALTGNSEFIDAAALADQTFNPIVDTAPIDPISNPAVVLTSDRSAVVEEDPDNRKVTLSVSRGSTEGDLTLSYSILGVGALPTNADDFVDGALAGEVTILDGEDTASFEIEVADDGLDEGPETFDVVASLNDADASEYELLVSSVRVTIEDNDESGLTYRVVTQPGEGSASISDSTLTFDPGDDFQDLAEGETRDVVVQVQAIDENGEVSNVADVTVTVTGTNDLPVLAASVAATSEDGPSIDIDLAALGDDIDSDDDGTSLIYNIITEPSEGSASISGTTLTFDPGSDFQELAEGETREVIVQIQATDSHGATSDVADVAITVTGTNDAPTLAASTLAAEEDGPNVALDLASLADDIDSDDDGSSLTYSIITEPSEGSASISGTTLNFDPVEDFQDLAEGETRDVIVTVLATDSHGAVSDTSDIVVTVTGTNDAPFLSSITIGAEEDGSAVDLDLSTITSDVDAGESETTPDRALEVGVAGDLSEADVDDARNSLSELSYEKFGLTDDGQFIFSSETSSDEAGEDKLGNLGVDRDAMILEGDMRQLGAIQHEVDSGLFSSEDDQDSNDSHDRAASAERLTVISEDEFEFA